MLDTGDGKFFLSFETYNMYFSYIKLKPSHISVNTAQRQECVNKDQIQLKVEIQAVKTVWTFHVIEGLQFPCIIGVDFLNENEVDLKFSSQAITIRKESKIVQPLHTEVSFDNERQKSLSEVEESDLNKVQRAELNNFSEKFSDLAEFNMSIEHREGSKNAVADALSRNSQSLDAESKPKVIALIRFNF